MEEKATMLKEMELSGLETDNGWGYYEVRNYYNDWKTKQMIEEMEADGISVDSELPKYIIAEKYHKWKSQKESIID